MTRLMKEMMKKQPARKATNVNPNYNPDSTRYMLYVTTDFYSRNGIQVYYDYDYYLTEDEANQQGHNLLDVPESEGGDVIDYVVIPIQYSDASRPAISGYLVKIWYGEDRYIPIDCIDAMSLLDGEMTLEQFIRKQKGEQDIFEDDYDVFEPSAEDLREWQMASCGLV